MVVPTGQLPMVLPLSTGGIRSVFVVVARRLVECGQVGVDVVDFGDVEVVVESEGLAPVVAGRVGVADGVVSVGKAVVGPGLLVPVAGLGGQGEGGGVVGAGLLGVAGGMVGLADAVEGLS